VYTLYYELLFTSWELFCELRKLIHLINCKKANSATSFVNIRFLYTYILVVTHRNNEKNLQSQRAPKYLTEQSSQITASSFQNAVYHHYKNQHTGTVPKYHYTIFWSKLFWYNR
jgi:hypothetical protein